MLRSPCDRLEKKDRPKVEKKPVPTIDAAETAKAIEAAREHRVLIPLLLGSLCGLRRGEILALRWKSVDLERAQLAVVASIEQVGKVCREKETKSSKCRTIAMPSLLVEELRRQRIIQATEMLRCGVGLNADSYVVARQDGERINPRTLTSWVSRFMNLRGSKVRLHGLRHSHASHMLAEGVHPKVVQERLGHASIAITMDIYSHLLPNMQVDAAAKIDAVLRAAQKNT